MAGIPEELRKRLKGALGTDPPDNLEGETLLSYIEEVRKTSPALYRELVDALQEQAVLEIGKAPSVKTPRPLSLARFLYKQDAEGNWVFDRKRGIALTLIVVLGVIFLIQLLLVPRGRPAPTTTQHSPAQQAIPSPDQEASAPTPSEEKGEEAQAPQKPEAQVPLPPQTQPATTPQGEEQTTQGNAPPPPPPNPTPDLPPPPDYEGGAQAETNIITLYRREKAEEGSNWAPVRQPAQEGQNAPAGSPLLVQVRGGKPEDAPAQVQESWISLSPRGENQTAPTWQKVKGEAPPQGEASAWIQRKAPSPQGEVVTVYKREEKKEGSWTALDGTPSTVTSQTPTQARSQEKATPTASETSQTPSAKPAEKQKATPPPQVGQEEEKAP